MHRNFPIFTPPVKAAGRLKPPRFFHPRSRQRIAAFFTPLLRLGLAALLAARRYAATGGERLYREREGQFFEACDGIGRGMAGTPGARPAAEGVRPGTCSGKRRKSPPEVDTAGFPARGGEGGTSGDAKLLLERGREDSGKVQMPLFGAGVEP